MLNYIKKSLRRKRARKITSEYPAKVSTYFLEKDGKTEFANWENPLIRPIELRQENIDFFRQFVKEGDLVIDIGANIGDTTVPMGIAAGASGLTLGFDPNPYVFKILEVNASLNKDKSNIIPFLLAITKEEEEFYFISSEASFGNGGLSKEKKSMHGKYVYPGKVKGVNLINFLNKNYSSWLPKLSFIKIDAEGYDKEIIKSISDLISEFKPVIVAESFGKNSKEEKMELFESVAAHGYKLKYFYDFDIHTKTSNIETSSELAKWKETVNFYALPV